MDGVRDRDDPPSGACEDPVDVPERAEQIAVVVVARGHDGQSEERGGERTVDVCVHEVGVQQVGLLRAYRPDHVEGHPRVRVERAAHAPVGHAGRVQGSVEARRVAAGHLEPEEASIDPALAQGWKQRQQVPLRASDSVDLVQMKDAGHEASSVS